MVKYNNMHESITDGKCHGVCDMKCDRLCDRQRLSQRLSWMEGVTEVQLFEKYLPLGELSGKDAQPTWN